MPIHEGAPKMEQSQEKKREIRRPEVVVSGDSRVQNALEKLMRVSDDATVELGRFDDTKKHFVNIHLRDSGIAALTLVYEDDGSIRAGFSTSPAIDQEVVAGVRGKIRQLEDEEKKNPSDVNTHNELDALKALLAIREAHAFMGGEE